MNAIRLSLEGDGAWPDLVSKELIHLGNDAPPIRIAALRGGMNSGNTSVAIVIEIGANKVVLVETSLRLFLAAADALRAKYGSE